MATDVASGSFHAKKTLIAPFYSDIDNICKDYCRNTLSRFLVQYDQENLVIWPHA